MIWNIKSVNFIKISNKTCASLLIIIIFNLEQHTTEISNNWNSTSKSEQALVSVATAPSG